MAATGSGVVSDDLIPIRLELNVGGKHVTEYFTWSREETIVTPAEFAAVLVADLGLPQNSTATIAASIAEQIAADRERLQNQLNAQEEDTSASMPPDAETAGESRQIIKLNVRVGGIVLKDQFEWDVCHEDNKPEAFAEILSADLGLGREFVPAIAHAVRDQLATASDAKRRRTACPKLTSRTAIRAASSVPAFEPVVEYLSLTQQDNLAKKEKREARLAQRMRRGTPSASEKAEKTVSQRRRASVEPN